MRQLYHEVSSEIVRCITRRYSTSFSIGIHMLHKSFHQAIYGIYGFVRVADEIVDSFHEYNQRALLDDFEADTFKAIEHGISTNPVLDAFQYAVHKYEIDVDLIQTFINSMRMDLAPRVYDRQAFEKYILGSAEVVGLMCLKVFVEGDETQYQKLKPAAMKLGAAFQKVNFLRDLAADFSKLGRSYFPGLDLHQFSPADKQKIEHEIENDFQKAFEGIKQLPKKAQFGVYTAYIYYLNLFKKIRKTPASDMMFRRVRISNQRKLFLLFTSFLRLNLRAI